MATPMQQGDVPLVQTTNDRPKTSYGLLDYAYSYVLSSSFFLRQSFVVLLVYSSRLMNPQAS